jgi:hypothetical protein
VLISYSHDSEEHRARALQLAQRLRQDGVDAWIDQFQPAPPQGWPTWMREQIEASDFIVLVCTEIYRRRFERREQPGIGRGTTWEGMLASQLQYEGRFNLETLVPVLLEGGSEDHIPTGLRAGTYHRLWDEYSHLLLRLTRQLGAAPDPLGELNLQPGMPERPPAQGLPVSKRQRNLWLVATGLLAIAALVYALATTPKTTGVYQACEIRVDGATEQIENAWIQLETGQTWRVNVANDTLVFECPPQGTEIAVVLQVDGEVRYRWSPVKFSEEQHYRVIPFNRMAEDVPPNFSPGNAQDKTGRNGSSWYPWVPDLDRQRTADDARIRDEASTVISPDDAIPRGEVTNVEGLAKTDDFDETGDTDTETIGGVGSTPPETTPQKSAKDKGTKKDQWIPRTKGSCWHFSTLDCLEATLSAGIRDDASGDLKVKLERQDMLDAIQMAQPLAKRCGKEYGAPSGTIVELIVVVNGRTGRVVRAQPLRAHRTSSLGTCVSHVFFEMATFPEIQNGTHNFQAELEM